MGVTVLVLGRSGSGKSCSLREFGPGEVAVLNVTGKPMPFRKRLDVYSGANGGGAGYPAILQALAANRRRCYVVDDANYLMANAQFARAKEPGYGKFVDMASDFKAMLDMAARTTRDTTVYVMMHPDFDADGRMKPKTAGRMLDEKLCVEGLFPIVLVADRREQGYVFATQTDGLTPAKTPMGMFDDELIVNDLRMVDDVIRDYYGLAPRTTGEEVEDVA